MDRKSELLREKILTNAHISHNKAQYRLQELNEESEICTQSFRQSLEEFSKSIDHAIGEYQLIKEELQDSINDCENK